MTHLVIYFNVLLGCIRVNFLDYGVPSGLDFLRGRISTHAKDLVRIRVPAFAFAVAGRRAVFDGPMMGE